MISLMGTSPVRFRNVSGSNIIGVTRRPAVFIRWVSSALIPDTGEAYGLESSICISDSFGTCTDNVFVLPPVDLLPQVILNRRCTLTDQSRSLCGIGKYPATSTMWLTVPRCALLLLFRSTRMKLPSFGKAPIFT